MWYMTGLHDVPCPNLLRKARAPTNLSSLNGSGSREYLRWKPSYLQQETSNGEGQRSLTEINLESSDNWRQSRDNTTKGYEVDRDGDLGCCGCILFFFSILFVIFFFPLALCMSLKVIAEYERAVIFRLGRVVAGGPKGPGMIFVFPCVDSMTKVDLRTISYDVPPQEILTKDTVTVSVDAVVYYRIQDPVAAVCNVDNAYRSSQLLAATTLRNVLGMKQMAEVLSEREHIAAMMQDMLEHSTAAWGIRIERVEVKDVRLPMQLQRAMAAEAEATREAKAKVVAAEGEQNASRALKEAGDVISESPAALQLRYLQSLGSIASQKESSILFPIPLNMMIDSNKVSRCFKSTSFSGSGSNPQSFFKEQDSTAKTDRIDSYATSNEAFSLQIESKDSATRQERDQMQQWKLSETLTPVPDDQNQRSYKWSVGKQIQEQLSTEMEVKADINYSSLEHERSDSMKEPLIDDTGSFNEQQITSTSQVDYSYAERSSAANLAYQVQDSFSEQEVTTTSQVDYAERNSATSPVYQVVEKRKVIITEKLDMEPQRRPEAVVRPRQREPYDETQTQHAVQVTTRTRSDIEKRPLLTSMEQTNESPTSSVRVSSEQHRQESVTTERSDRTEIRKGRYSTKIVIGKSDS
ncbi:hypothetical protein FSP39_018244 [Pinctada imbricata]|uniref:Band 7 domain-containing protein n=1 Tax=Pinctada imbricata TaxID=66713 RepID=A0AA88YJE3_PINIB|nr:hypothetical protein FSP39_018244 [Pinctada imbricata]